MKMRLIIVTFVCFALFLALTSTVIADQRSYVWTYEYNTLKRGEAEFESYFTLSTPEIGKTKGITSSEHRIELEVGMTDRFDFSVYQVFNQDPGESFKYEGFKLRSRYRFSDKGKNLVDLLAYIEYEDKPDFSNHEIEFKLIMAKDIGKLNIAVNPILKTEIGDELKFEGEYAIGVGYEINKLLKAGIEAKGSEHGHYIGPVISHGKNDLWITLGSAIKIGEIKNEKPEFQIRMLLGVGL